jgi:hypothetical protein
MTRRLIHRLLLALGVAGLSASPALAASGSSDALASIAAAGPAGSPFTSENDTPFPSSSYIVGATWTSKRYDPPANQEGDILPTIWSNDGSTFVMMDDGGVDPPKPGAIWRQSLAQISGVPPSLRFKHVGDPFAPRPRTWRQIAGNRDNDVGPLGPYYSIGFADVGGVWYATQQRDWDSTRNLGFTGLVGIAYSTNRGETWHFARKPFPAPLGNLTFVDGGARGGSYPDGYVYAIGTEREFNASRLLLGRVPVGVQNITDPSRWQWYNGMGAGVDAQGRALVNWSSAVSSAVPVMQWAGRITYPQMTYDSALKRYLLTFTYSYAPNPPGVWRNGAELVILEGRTPGGPFSFVARTRNFGPSNGYGAGFPPQWISANGRDLWLKWAANFDGCSKGLNCSGKYGFNVARVHLSVRLPAADRRTRALSAPALAAMSGTGAVASVVGVLFILWRRRARAGRRSEGLVRDRESGREPLADSAC